MDADGHYHAVFHHMYGTGTKTQWWLDATGGHAFSRDGFEWVYTGVAWCVARHSILGPRPVPAATQLATWPDIRFWVRVRRQLCGGADPLGPAAGPRRGNATSRYNTPQGQGATIR